MSWGVRARLPSPTVDVGAIERAARAVVAESGRHMRVTLDGTTVHFVVDGPEVRPWESALGFYPGNDLDEHWERCGYDGCSDLPITIHCREYPVDKYNDEAYAELDWDTAYSGNGLCPMIGQHLLDELARRLGAVVQAT